MKKLSNIKPSFNENTNLYNSLILDWKYNWLKETKLILAPYLDLKPLDWNFNLSMQFREADAG